MSASRKLLIAALLLAAPSAPAWAGAPAQAGDVAADAGTAAEQADAIRQARDIMYKPGPKVEKWDEGGADPEAEVRALGADEYYLVETGVHGDRSVSILTDRPIADFAPAGWRIAASYGSPAAPLDNPSIGFGHLSARFVMAVRGGSRRIKDVNCGEKIGHAMLYELPGVPPSAEDEGIADFFQGAMLAADGFQVCARFDGDRQAGYRLRGFLPDGRSLPEISAQVERVAIVPAAPVESLLKPPSPAPAIPPR